MNFQNAKIYKLVNTKTEDIYVGSTCSVLRKRLFEHKHKKDNRKVYTHLNQIGWDKVHIVLIENYPCSDKFELCKREQYWIDSLQPSLNSIRANTNRKTDISDDDTLKCSSCHKIKDVFQNFVDDDLTFFKTCFDCRRRKNKKIICPFCCEEFLKL